MMPREEIVGALARGYCTEENKNKIVDPTLIKAMADEEQIISLTQELARKNEEVAMLKKENEGYKNLIKNCPQAQVCPYVKTISFTPDLELAKKVIEEQREELEACRDANVQKKKRIATLEDALKRAEDELSQLKKQGEVRVSVEEIENEIRTWEKCRHKGNCCSSCIEDIKMGYGDDIEACCCQHKGICGIAQAIHALITTRKGLV